MADPQMPRACMFRVPSLHSLLPITLYVE